MVAFKINNFGFVIRRMMMFSYCWLFKLFKIGLFNFHFSLDSSGLLYFHFLDRSLNSAFFKVFDYGKIV